MRLRFYLGAVTMVLVGLCTIASADVVVYDDFDYGTTHSGAVDTSLWSIVGSSPIVSESGSILYVGSSSSNPGWTVLTSTAGWDPAATNTYEWKYKSYSGSGANPYFGLASGDNAHNIFFRQYSTGKWAIYVNGAKVSGDLAAPVAEHPYDFVRTADTWQFVDCGISPNYVHTLVYETAPGVVGFAAGDLVHYWTQVRAGSTGRVGLGYAAGPEVPEPATCTLLATGLIGLLACAWRKRSSKINRVSCAVALTFALTILMGLPTANADIVTVDSAAFSYGLSYGSTSGSIFSWLMTSGNTPASGYTQGDFTLTPTGASAGMSGTGPIFTGRVFATGGAGRSSASSSDFSLSLAGSYNGTAVPANAINCQLEVELTNLSIWGVAYSGYSGSTSIAWSETTPDHNTYTSSSLALSSVSTTSGFGTASNYKHLIADPSDYYVSLPTPTTVVTRTFNLGSAHDDALDGLEVMGIIHLTYETVVPEPGTLALLATGAIGLLAYGWRKRK